MIIALVIGSLVLLGLFSWLATRFNWFRSAENLQEPTEPELCCGAHEICELDNLQIVDTKPIYYDDETLDAYRDMDPETYSDDINAQFEEVFESLLPQEVAGWLRSLQLRALKLPPYLYEQALSIVSERRSPNNKTEKLPL